MKALRTEAGLFLSNSSHLKALVSKKHISISILWGYLYSTLLGFMIGGFTWDIPVIGFAYVRFWGPIVSISDIL